MSVRECAISSQVLSNRLPMSASEHEITYPLSSRTINSLIRWCFSGGKSSGKIRTTDSSCVAITIRPFFPIPTIHGPRCAVLQRLSISSSLASVNITLPCFGTCPDWLGRSCQSHPPPDVSAYVALAGDGEIKHKIRNSQTTRPELSAMVSDNTPAKCGANNRYSAVEHAQRLAQLFSPWSL